MFSNAGLSTENYDVFLYSQANNSAINSDITITVSSRYIDATSKTYLTETKNWNITDLGQVPTIEIASNISGVADGFSTNDATITLTFTAGLSTSNFEESDITVTNGTLSSFVGSGTTYTVTFTPTEQGVCTINVAAGTFSDSSNNNNNIAASQFNWTFDSVVPTVTNVTSTKTDGSYTIDEVIPVAVTFSEVVNVIETPTLTLETGSNDVVVNYSSGTGSNTLIFNYTVAVGHNSIDLDYVDTSALALNSGTIKDAATNNATLTLVSPGNANSLGANKALVIDTAAPTINLVGNPTVTIEVGATYTDQGATATDNYDTGLTVVVGGDTVDTAIVGTYTVTYDVSDSNGNAAVQVTRTVSVVDTTVPVITLTGEPTVTTEVGATYTEQGATATDNYDPALTVVVGGDTVDTSIVGTYTVTYNVSDSNGNAAVQVTRIVSVVDTTVPLITLTGEPTVTTEVGATYTDQGATATDNYDPALTVVVGGDTVDTSIVGTYTVTYNVSDSNSNAAVQVTRIVSVVDTTVPLITLTGEPTVTTEVGATYTDPGATATDNYDPALTVVVGGDTVDTSIVGTYTVTYNVSDSNSNAAVQVTRIVSVVDTTVPLITLTGEPTVTTEVGATYTDPGATATDNYDPALTVVVGGDTVDTSIVGTYTVTYNVSDSNGNAAVQVTRIVSVVDTTVPLITLTGEPTVTTEVGATYTDPGATATDNYDPALTVVVGGDTVDTSIVGTYTVTYNVSDSNSNAAVQVTRIVSVVDTTVPVITLTGEPTVTIEVGATYTEQGATATDNYDPALTVVVGGDTVDTTTLGTYTVTYNVSDASGNAAVEVTRTVTVTEVLGLDSTEINSVSIYPNPTTSKWTVESSRVINTLTLFNLLGQKVLEQTVNDKKVNIDASNLKTGVYMLKVNKTTLKRVIKR